MECMEFVIMFGILASILSIVGLVQLWRMWEGTRQGSVLRFCSRILG